MLSHGSRNLERSIVEILSENSPATALALKEMIALRYRRYTHQAIYKELNKLQEAGVVVKHRGNYSLSLPWIFNLMEVAESMYKVHIESASISTLLPGGKRKHTWHFSNLLKMDDFWIHALIILFQNSGTGVMYQWLPHAWFTLLHDHKARLFETALRRGGYKINRIIGGDTFLDTTHSRTWPQDIIEFSHRVSPFHQERDSYYCVTGDFVLSILLTKKTAKALDKLYASILSKDDLNIALVIEVISEQTKVVVTLERSKAKAKRLLSTFKLHFGH